MSELGDSEEWSRLAKINRFYFKKNPKLKFSDVERIHINGGRLTFVEHDEDGEVVRKITIKYASGQEGLNQLQNEMLCLQVLKGAEHVVRTIALAHSRINVSGTGRDREYPIIALEYLPFGSLAQLRERAANAGRLIPNRVLWRVFLCLARQQIAFLFMPQKTSPDAPLWREIIGPEFGYSSRIGFIEPNNLEDSRNHRFRDYSRETEEHAMVPAVVSTDFSRGRLRDEFEDTYLSNLRAIGYCMTALALNIAAEENLRYETAYRVMTNSQARSIFPEQDIPEQEILTDAPNLLMEAPGIDHQLKELIARCLAYNEGDMPTWRNLVLLCEDGFKFRSPDKIEDMPPVREEELVDGGDGRFVREFILNADSNTGRSMLGEQNRFGEWS